MITAALETASKDNKRYFVDVRVGCAAIRDRQHPSYNPEYHGLSSELEDVVEYVLGKRDFDPASEWVLDDDEVERLYKRCEQLNNEEDETSTPADNVDEDRRLNIVEWLRAFHSGEFDFSDRDVQIKAGWYDWFCKDGLLYKKTRKLGSYLQKVVNANKVSNRFNPTKCYVLFKNNCPVCGSLYDDFRICDSETGSVLYTIVPKSGHNSAKDLPVEMWGPDNKFQEPLFKGKSFDSLLLWFAGIEL
jgi:hypothetical protein